MIGWERHQWRKELLPPVFIFQGTNDRKRGRAVASNKGNVPPTHNENSDEWTTETTFASFVQGVNLSGDNIRDENREFGATSDAAHP